MGRKTPLGIRSHGMRFPVSPSMPPGRSTAALKQDLYEARESGPALRIVGKGDVVLELGGGIGYMSTLLAPHRRPAHLHVFEAMMPAGLADHAKASSNKVVCLRRDWPLT